MSKKSRVKYSLETKMKAIEMKKDGISVKAIQEALHIKSPSQVYTWWYWYRDAIYSALNKQLENSIALVMVQKVPQMKRY